MSEPLTLELAEVRPSQLYLDAEKLAEVIEWFDFDEPHLDPLPVLPHPDDDVAGDRGWYLTDGHTRAFVARLAGIEELRVVRDPDKDDLSLGVYERCLEWCEADGITEIGDLSGRVLSHGTFMEKWVRRCHALSEHPGDPEDVPTE